jgi:hypothetical protein
MDTMSLQEIIISGWQILALIGITAGLWGVFKKAGRSSWKALIPFYNLYILFRITGQSGWLSLVFLTPLIIVTFNTFDLLFGNSIGAELGGIFLLLILLLVVQVIMLVIYARTAYLISKVFSKSFWFAGGLIFLPFIFWPILGFGGAKYRGPVAHPKMVAAGTGAHIDPTKVSDGDESGEADWKESN